MIWVLGVLCALALVALFFPFIFWIDFSADFKGVTVGVRFFKKKVYTYEKKFGKKELSEDEDSSVAINEETAKAPAAPVELKAAPQAEKAETPKAEQKIEQKAEPEAKPETEKKPEPEKKAEPEKSVEPEKQIETSKAPEKPVEKKEEPKPVEKLSEKKESSEKDALEDEKSSDDDKKEKRSLTDQEFWTLLLTPEFDERAWWAVRHALSALFSLFKIRFIDCFVEGIRFQEYENMGYAAALNGFLKSFPYIGAWDFRMDWTRDHEPHAEGHVRMSVNLCRTLCLFLTTLFYGGIVAFTFWRRRVRILKTGELPELGFIRSKIVKMMSEDD